MKIKLRKQSHEIETLLNYADILNHIVKCGRTCYKSELSEDIIKKHSVEYDISKKQAVKELNEDFIRRIPIGKGHETLLEHFSFTVRFVTNRGCSHELVRHRISSFSQESTRYVNYNNKGMEFIIPSWLSIPVGTYELYKKLSNMEWSLRGKDGEIDVDYNEWNWLSCIGEFTGTYNELLGMGQRPEQARGVLPNDLKTEIVCTSNLRQWRTIFKQRAINKAAHPQMRELMLPLLDELKETLPVFFEDIV